jgi:hypothetical protein
VKVLASLAATLLLSACASAGSTGAAGFGAEPSPDASAAVVLTPSPSPATPAPRPSAAAPIWRVGASPLPLRPDGFGQVLPTPTVLRNRRLPTLDLLRPPADGRFAATVGVITPAIRTRMGQTWSAACPVPLSGLRYLTVVFRGFDGKAHRGELVVATRMAPKVVSVFRTLFANGFPIEEMRLPTSKDLRDKPTGDGNNTAAYVCRAARGQTRFSSHAYGVAVDVNPFQNPEVRRDLVLPELASAYKDRTWYRSGMFLAGDRGVRAFAAIGWTWGGTWHTSRDPMHFSATGT